MVVMHTKRGAAYLMPPYSRAERDYMREMLRGTPTTVTMPRPAAPQPQAPAPPLQEGHDEKQR